MKPVSSITSPAVPLLRDDIAAEMIFSDRDHKSMACNDATDRAFAQWRYTDWSKRNRDPNFVLNKRDAIGTRLLLGGMNFGHGSSTQPAVQALLDFGIEAIIAPSIAPMFKRTCISNGLLPIELPIEVLHVLQWEMVRIDLEAQTVSARERSWHFEIPPKDKRTLIQGFDSSNAILASFKFAMARFLKSDSNH